MFQDFRLAVRQLSRTPGFALAAILSIGLGLGANATMVGVLDRLLFRAPSGISEPDRVVRLYERRRFGEGGQVTNSSLTYPDVAVVGQGSSMFSAVASYSRTDLSLGRGPDARRVWGVLASGEYFNALGAKPILGRFFGPTEDALPAGTPVVVLSEGFWRSEFGGTPDVIGRRIDLIDQPYTVIGVAPAGFTGAELAPVDVWVPLSTGAALATNSEWYQTRNWQWLMGVARLAPGVTPSQAEAEATAHYRAGREGLRFSDPEGRMQLGSIIPGRRPDAPAEARIALWLAGVSAVVLLIACANVANLLLARAAARRRETAVRMALGGSRSRLARLVLTESLSLAVAGLLVGVLCAWWLGDLLRITLLPGVAWDSSPVNLRVMLVASVASLGVGLLSGLVPAFQAGRTDLVTSLRSGTAGGGGGHRARARTALLLAQTILSVVLLAGAGLFVRSLARANAVDLGFDSRQVLLGNIDLRTLGYTPAQREQFYLEARERLAALPGVDRVSLATSVPFQWSMATLVKVPGRDSLPRLADGGPYYTAVTPEFFATMGMKLRAGRAFTESDGPGAPMVVMVNETMARRLWPGENALGKCFTVGETNPACREIVGVVADAHRQELRTVESMQYYLPVAQATEDEVRGLLVRARGRPELVAGTVRRTLQTLRPNLPYAAVYPLQDLVDPEIRPVRLGATMFALMGMLALAIAAVGLYGVLSYSVSQRTREIGIRTALGAARRELYRMVLAEGIGVTLIGLVVGSGLALVIGRSLAPVLFQTQPYDPLSYGVVAIVLLVVALAASLMPARRAARVDPMVALRSE